MEILHETIRIFGDVSKLAVLCNSNGFEITAPAIRAWVKNGWISQQNALMIATVAKKEADKLSALADKFLNV